MSDALMDLTYKIGAIILMIALLIVIIVSTGCVSAARHVALGPDPLPPTPLFTPTPTPIKTSPTPTPTPDYANCFEAAPYCYRLRDWHHMFIPNVLQNETDLILHATVYDYRILDYYHYHSPSYGTYSFDIHRPYPGFKYMFIYVNVYSDTDADPYGFDRKNWVVQYKEHVYYYDWEYDPTKWIYELQHDMNYNGESAVGPYGYRIVQEPGTGIITAEQLGWIYKGRSNAWDGYIIFEIPVEAEEKDLKVGANFANIGGYAWWSLTK